MIIRLSMIGLVSLLLIVLNLSLPLAAHADSPPSEVLAAAQSGLPSFLKSITSDEIPMFGFTGSQELVQATLGEPYQAFLISPDALKAYHSGTPLSALLTKTNRWEFPVLVGGDARTMLTVDMMQGKWEAVTIGGLDLPKNLESAKKALPTLVTARTRGPYTTKLVQVLQVHASFLAVESANGDYLVPIMTRPPRGLQNLEMYSLDEVVPNLNTDVQNSIQPDRDGANAAPGGAGGPVTGQTFSVRDFGLLGALLLGGVATAVGLKVLRKKTLT